MYWPNGVPRVYAVNGPNIPIAPSSNLEESQSETSEDEQRQEEVPENPEKDGANPWANEPINGLCVSRGGHLFATMTESSMTIWQTKVRVFRDYELCAQLKKTI